MRHIRPTIGAILALLLLPGATRCLAQNDEVVATVNGQPIMASTLHDELLRRWGDIALGALIQELAVEQAAAEVGISVTPDEVDQRKDTFQRNVDLKGATTGQNFSMWLAQQKFTPYAFRRWIRTELLLEKMVTDQAKVSDQDVADYWEQNRERFRRPERMRVSHICVTDRAEAARIRAEIVQGRSFEEAAREHSIDPYTREQGGAFGVITRGESSFQKAAFALDADKQMTEPVQTEKGWHIIRRDEYMPAGVPEFDDVDDEIKEQLERQKLMVLMNNKRTEIMRSARVEQEIDPDDLAGR